MSGPLGRSPLSHGELYHTGFVVDDLEASMQELGPLLAVTWLTGGGTVQIDTPDGPGDGSQIRSETVETRYAMSAEGPHHVELVQAVAGTLYVATGAAAAHHLGLCARAVCRGKPGDAARAEGWGTCVRRDAQRARCRGLDRRQVCRPAGAKRLLVARSALST